MQDISENKENKELILELVHFEKLDKFLDNNSG